MRSALGDGIKQGEEGLEEWGKKGEEEEGEEDGQHKASELANGRHTKAELRWVCLAEKKQNEKGAYA